MHGCRRYPRPRLRPTCATTHAPCRLSSPRRISPNSIAPTPAPHRDHSTAGCGRPNSPQHPWRRGLGACNRERGCGQIARETSTQSAPRWSGRPEPARKTTRRHIMKPEFNTEVIVTCAVTGGGDTVGKHPSIPVTPKEIAAAAIEAAKAGRDCRPLPRARAGNRPELHEKGAVRGGRGPGARQRHRRDSESHRRQRRVVHPPGRQSRSGGGRQ